MKPPTKIENDALYPHISVDGLVVTTLEPTDRQIATVFQTCAPIRPLRRSPARLPRSPRTVDLLQPAANRAPPALRDGGPRPRRRPTTLSAPSAPGPH